MQHYTAERPRVVITAGFGTNEDASSVHGARRQQGRGICAIAEGETVDGAQTVCNALISVPWRRK